MSKNRFKPMTPRGFRTPAYSVPLFTDSHIELAFSGATNSDGQLLISERIRVPDEISELVCIARTTVTRADDEEESGFDVLAVLAATDPRYGDRVHDVTTGTPVNIDVFGKLLGGSEFGIEIYVTAFTPRTDISINVKLIFYRSTLSSVCADVLSESTTLTPICFAIPEDLLLASARQMQTKRGPFVLESGIADELKIRVSHILDDDETVRLDTHNEKIIITGEVQVELAFGQFGNALARSTAAIRVYAKPTMGQQDVDLFQLQFEDGNLTTDPSSTIVNWDVLSRYFGTPDEANEFLESALRAIVNRQRPVELLLKNYVATWPLPELWNQVTDYELDFERFDYRSCEIKVLDETERVRYLFVVFELRSLRLPIPCICGETRLSGNGQVSSMARSQFFSWQAFGHARKLLTMVGASQSALEEAVRPHADAAQTGNISFEKSGIKVSANYYFRTALVSFHVGSNRFSAEVAAASGGKARAKLRTGDCGSDTTAAAASISISVPEIALTWVFEYSVSGSGIPVTISYRIRADANIGAVNVELDAMGFPMDQVSGEIIERIANGLRGTIEEEVESRASMELFHAESDLGPHMLPVDQIFRLDDCWQLLMFPWLSE